MICQILDYNTQRKFHHHGQLLNSRASEATPFQLPRAIVSFTCVAICADDNWKKKKKKKNEQKMLKFLFSTHKRTENSEWKWRWEVEVTGPSEEETEKREVCRVRARISPAF